MEYRNNFRNTKMPTDFHSFAEKAIEIAGKAGERKRQHAMQMQGDLSRSRMAEIGRKEQGQTRRAEMRMAGKMDSGGLRAAGSPESTRMKSFDFANKAMSEMYPDRFNPVTKKPFTPEAWQARTTELADKREAYGGVQPTAEQPVAGGLSGRGRVVTEGGRQYDVTPGGGHSEGMASRGMMEAAGFLPRGMSGGSTQTLEGEVPGVGGEMQEAAGIEGMQEAAAETPQLKPGEAAAMLQAEYNKENPDPSIIASLKKMIGGGMQWLGGKMLSPEGSYVTAPKGLEGYPRR